MATSVIVVRNGCSEKRARGMIFIEYPSSLKKMTLMITVGTSIRSILRKSRMLKISCVIIIVMYLFQIDSLTLHCRGLVTAIGCIRETALLRFFTTSGWGDYFPKFPRDQTWSTFAQAAAYAF